LELENWSLKVHIPVLLKETIEALDPKPNENFIDCTFGWGGHSLAILERNAPNGLVLGIEWDGQSLAALPQEVQKNPRLMIENDSYVNIAAIAEKRNFGKISGILFDLGMSSWHVDESKKGFSFSKDEPLDMRYAKDTPLTAERIINDYPAAKLEILFENYGQERRAAKIAKAIEKARMAKRIDSTAALARIVEAAAGRSYARPALARIFQALRIEVNAEFENISRGIDDGFEIMAGGGRMAAITFHSLEDGIVKRKFRELVKLGKAKLLFAKPIVPGEEEVQKNPRSRSAKLRAIEKIIK